MSETGSRISISYPKSRQRKLNSSIRLMHSRALLNTSRRLVQRSVNQSINSGTSLRNNNVSLAKKVSELQIELNSQRMAAQQANIDLVKCRLELMRLQSYKEARERIKNAFLNIQESLCSQVELGMSVINLVKETMSVLESNESSNQVTKCPSILGDTTFDLDATVSILRGITRRGHVTGRDFRRREFNNIPEMENSPRTLTDNFIEEVRCLGTDGNNTNEDKYTNDQELNPLPLGETSNVGRPSHPSEGNLSVPSSPAPAEEEEQLPEILATPRSCVSPNKDDDVEKETLRRETVGETNETATVTAPPPVDVVNRNENNAVVPHEDWSTRSHLVRRARLNAKPIIDTSSFLEPPVVKKKKKKVVKRRLIRSADSEDDDDDDDDDGDDGKGKNAGTMKNNDDGNKTDGKSRSKGLKVRKTNNPDIVESVPQQTTGRIIETCFRRPGQLTFKVDAKNPLNICARSGTVVNRQNNPSSAVEQGKQQRKTRSKTRFIDCITGSKSPDSRSSDKENMAGNERKLPQGIKSANVFDLSMNQTANLSVLPPTLNDLRIIKQGEKYQQQVEGLKDRQGDSTEGKISSTAAATRKRPVLGELQLQNGEVNSPIGDNRRPSVLLVPLVSGNQPPDSDAKESKSRKGKFRRLCLHDDGDENGAVGSNNNNNNGTAPRKSLRNKRKSIDNVVVDPLITARSYHFIPLANKHQLSCDLFPQVLILGKSRGLASCVHFRAPFSG
uniref:Uncharacterized protein n=1 Tax=Trichobilharzia regenti TaxID=157069 RepID=A0AA85J429_TRIRE|nr:unnamed protein product [Trichobilharzia regenti]